MLIEIEYKSLCQKMCLLICCMEQRKLRLQVCLLDYF